MTMQASVHGRLGNDPKPIQTKTGNPMCTASIAVDVSERDQEATIWIKVVAFGRLAELLERHAKGETLNAAGKLTLSKWTTTEGVERETWQLIADSIVSARSTRPGGGQRRPQQPQSRPAQQRASASFQAPAFADAIPDFG